MGNQRKSTAKKLPYKVLGKKVAVHAHIVFKGAADPEDYVTQRVRSEWPMDDPRYAVAQEARKAALERKAREQQEREPSSIQRYVLK